MKNLEDKTPTSYPIPISRSPDARVYRAGNPLLTQHLRLCMVLEQLTSWPAGDNMFHGAPWATPILGPGCLEVGEHPALHSEAVQEAVRHWLENASVDFPRGLGDPAREASRFVEALYEDRCASDPGDSSSSRQNLAIDRATAGLAVLATLLTWAYHESRATAREPAARWWATESASIEPSMPGGVKQSTTNAAIALTDRLLGSSEPLVGAADTAVRRLLKSIRSHLSHGRLPLEDTRLLAEVTWLALIEGSSIYPGWSDLLLKLVLRYSESHPPAGIRPNLMELTELEAAVGELLRHGTERSWDNRAADARTTNPDRDRLYAATAELLEAQASVFAALHPPEWFHDDPDVQATLLEEYQAAKLLTNAIAKDSNAALEALHVGQRVDEPQVPHPTCFVTSFDIELEMTLWARGTQFLLVLPALVVSHAGNSAEIAWLAADVDPAKRPNPASPPTLDELMRGPHSWRVAHHVIKGSSEGGVPIVVRLSGAPLISLPDPTRDQSLAGELKEVGLSQAQYLHHALTVDEYTSQRQSENEWFFAGQRSLPCRPKLHRGLPDPLATGTSSNDRVWLALGVQLDDPAIRSRVLAQLSASAAVRRADEAGDMPTGTAGPPTSDVRGVAVNRRIDEDKATALHWLGFDLVLDLDCGDLTPDIAHCARHLEEMLRTMPKERMPDTDARSLRWARAREQSCKLRQEDLGHQR